MSTNSPPMSVQLYSLREAAKTNFDQVLERLAGIGFKGVEPFHLFDKTPAEFHQQVVSLGMTVSSSHVPWINHSESINEVVETVQALGLSRAPGGFGPEDFKDTAQLQRTIATTAGYVDALKPHGVSLFLHNHYWEFNVIDGQVAYHQLQDAIPEVEFELDTYWAANFGACNPAQELSRIASRTPLLHIKDGPLEKGQSNVALGQGKMDIPALFEAADADVLEWAVIEFDQCDTDMFAAIEKSYQYLKFNNLAHGNV